MKKIYVSSTKHDFNVYRVDQLNAGMFNHDRNKYYVDGQIRKPRR